MTFTNKTSKVTSADQKTRTVTFINGDIKHILEDGKVVSTLVKYSLMVNNRARLHFSQLHLTRLDIIGDFLSGVLLRSLPDDTYHPPKRSGGSSLPQQADW